MMIIIGNIPSDDHSYYHNIRKRVSENDSQIAGQPHGHTHVYAVADPRGGQGVRTPPEIPGKNFLHMEK